jgi:Zn-dependent proteases
MGLIGLLLKDPAAFLILTIPLLYSIIIHEIAHGWVASLFGDDTARSSGRLSLNPLVHLDPIGTLALFIVGFGWARPVPIDYSKIRHFRLGLVCISLAGCLANIIIATLAILALQFTAITSYPIAVSVIFVIAKINIMLGALNLIPVPPLDGSRILLGILPEKGQAALVRLEPYGLLILFGLLFTGFLNPVIMFVQNTIMALIRLILRI